MRRFLRFCALMLAVSVLVFLYASDWFAAWDGHAVSIRPPETDDASNLTVLIVEADGSSFERTWPADWVRPLGLSVDPLAIPPDDLPDDAAATRKSAWALHLLLQDGEGEFRALPTTSPATLGLGFLVLILGIAGRNMVVAGSPFSIEPVGLSLPKGQPPSGQAAPPPRGGRAQKGPPPPRRRKGQGRR